MSSAVIPGEPGLVARIANWANSVPAEAITDTSLRQAKLLVLDTIGCGFAAVDEVLPRAVLDLVREEGGAPRCTLIGSWEKTSAANAVLANGVLIRALDLNDYVDRDHPSDNIPVALTIGEMLNAPSRDMLAAIVVGYELYGRMKHLIPMDSPWDGTTISGAVGAVMAGRLLGLDDARLGHAIALAMGRSATSALARFGSISSLKALANPSVAQSAVQAALLAARGATGPLALFESRRGMRGVFSRREAWDALTAPFPQNSYVLQANIKPYPSLVTGQAAVAAALDLHRQLGDEAQHVASLRIVMADLPAVRIQQEDRGRWDPQTREAADHCFQFLVAVTLIDGAFGLAQYDNERWNDPQVRALMGRMELGVDACLNERAPTGAYPCALRAIDRDGREHIAEALAPPGFSRGGLREDDVIAKFHSLTADRMNAAEREAIVDAALRLDGAGDCDSFFSTLRAPFQQHGRSR